MNTFWHNLPTPFTVLAPMDGVTDMVFRQIVTQIGKPDVLFTEFTSCDGLMSEGRKRVEQNLLFEPNEQPIVAQIWGANPKNFYETAKHIKKLGFSGIDINMGCPHRPVVKNGSCSALIKNQPLAAEIIKATKEGADGLPVSVKTRIGFETENIDEWIGFLLKQNLAALTVHLRTVAELSKVPAHWELMPKILEMRKKYAPETVIIGNGDITCLKEINEKYKKYGCEGFMIGQGVFANPWIFDNSREKADITVEERFEILLRHINLYEKTWGKKKNYANLKKFCKAYINNFPDASRYREKIMEVKSLAELREEVIKLSHVTQCHPDQA
ncbi:tRNA-dihydrouridine synthase [Patescibacteria group bacterium]|nr:tRNA-dihydrouridine synthase [Patescibacteria group bacterium]